MGVIETACIKKTRTLLRRIRRVDMAVRDDLIPVRVKGAATVQKFIKGRPCGENISTRSCRKYAGNPTR